MFAIITLDILYTLKLMYTYHGPSTLGNCVSGILQKYAENAESVPLTSSIYAFKHNVPQYFSVVKPSVA